jgi:hypothetical protein
MAKPTPAELEAALRLLNVTDAICYRPTLEKPAYCLRASGHGAARAIDMVFESYNLPFYSGEGVVSGKVSDVAFAFIHADQLDLER